MKPMLALAVLTTAAALPQRTQAQDAAAGEQVFKQCLPCHSIGLDAKNKVGPELNGLDGRHSGTAPGYSYSDANKNSGIVWNEANFKKYIHDSRADDSGHQDDLSRRQEREAGRQSLGLSQAIPP